MSTVAPCPLRVLLALPEPVATSFRRAFKALRHDVDVTCILTSALSMYLAERGYYHTLYISPTDWRVLGSADRKFYAMQVNLLVFILDTVTSDDLIDTQAVLYARDSLGVTEVVSLIADTHVRLVQGSTLTECVTASDGRLAFFGDEACWSDSDFIPLSVTKYLLQEKENRPMPHVFISYVRQNQDIVDRLCRELQASGVRYWLDREQINPGQRWQHSIREAIESGAFFIACFSDEYVQRSTTYMNEELILAVKQLRLRPINRTWFIPLRLSNCTIPPLEIGPGETLGDIQWVDLFDDNWQEGVRRIIKVVLPEFMP